MKLHQTLSLLGIFFFTIILLMQFPSPKQTNRNVNNTTFQSGNETCGAAVMEMILKFYGLKMPINDIEVAVVEKGSGSSFLALKEFAQSRGLNAQGWQLTFSQLEKSVFPCIAYINNSHFVVIDSITKGNVYTRDPLIGSVKMLNREFIKIWSGKVLLFSRPTAIKNNDLNERGDGMRF